MVVLAVGEVLLSEEVRCRRKALKHISIMLPNVQYSQTPTNKTDIHLWRAVLEPFPYPVPPCEIALLAVGNGVSHNHYLQQSRGHVRRFSHDSLDLE